MLTAVIGGTLVLETNGIDRCRLDSCHQNCADGRRLYCRWGWALAFLGIFPRSKSSTERNLLQLH